MEINDKFLSLFSKTSYFRREHERYTYDNVKGNGS